MLQVNRQSSRESIFRAHLEYGLEEARAADLGRSVHHWLEYQVACRRGMLLSESYLAQPVGEFLRAHHSGDIKTEYTINGLKIGKRGRPRQLDYVLLSRDSSRLTDAIEAKWVAARGDPQRVVDDLLRLERIRSRTAGQSVNRYFLVAGTNANFLSKFENLQVQNGMLSSFLKPLLNTTQHTTKQVQVGTSHGPWRQFFKNFGESYQVPLPKTFHTTLVEFVAGRTIRVAIWRVTSSKGRSTLDASSM